MNIMKDTTIYFLIGMLFMCQILTYGYAVGWLYGEYPSVEDTWFEALLCRIAAVGVACSGPLGLLIVFYDTERFKYGWKL